MKNVEKLVPVAVAGLVLASAGTVDARAEDTTPAVDTNPATSEEEKVESSASSSEIKSATTVTETSGTTEDGTKTTDSIINVDTDGNTVTDEGQVTTQTEVTDSTTSEPVPTGPSTSTTVTNPDGSTTTTTTTPTETTTTETSETEIKAEITPPEDNTPPTDTEKEKLENDLNDGFKGQEDGWKLDDVKEGDEIGGFKATGKTKSEPVESTNELGQKVTETTTTVTFEKVVEDTDDNKPLTDAELGVILGAELTKTGENTYTYTKDGATVTVTVKANTGSETTTTTYSIKVSQTTKKIDDKNVEGSETVNGGNGTIYGEDDDTASVYDEFIDEVLNAANGGDSHYTKVSATTENGTTTTVVRNDSAHMEYTITEEEIPLTGTPSNDIILEWLGDKYTKAEDKDGNEIIVTKDGGYKVNITTDKLTGKTVVRTIKVVDLQAGQEGHGGAGSGQTEDEVQTKAFKDALNEAFEADFGEDYASIVGMYRPAQNSDGSWTVEVVVGGKTYTYTLSASAETDTKKWDVSNITDYIDGSGSTTTITGSAVVTGEKVVWTESETPFELTKEGKVTFKAGASFGVGNVTSVTQNDDGTTTVKVEDSEGNTYTYTVSYTSLDSLTQEQKDELLAKIKDATGSVDITKLTDFQKISWEVKQDVTETGTTSSEVTVIEGITQTTDGGYTFKDGDKNITLDAEGKYATTTTSADGKTVTNTIYVLKTVTANTPEIKADNLTAIQEILGKDYSGLEIDKEGKLTALYKGQRVTVELPATYETYTVEKTVTTVTSSTQTGSATATWGDKATEAEIKAAQEKADKEAKDRLIENIVNAIKAAQKEGKEVYYGEHKLSLDENGQLAYGELGNLTPITSGDMPIWFEIQNVINFADMKGDDLKDFLEDAESNGTASKMGHLHLELLVGSSLKTEEHPEGEDCAVLGDGLQVWVSKTVDGILGPDVETYGENRKHQAGLSNEMDYDEQGEGFYQYGRTENQALDDANQYPNGIWSENGDGVRYSDYKFYKVVGQVAHDLYTGTQTGADGVIATKTEKVTVNKDDTYKRGAKRYITVDGVEYRVKKDNGVYSYTKETKAEDIADGIIRDLAAQGVDTATKVKFTKDGKTFYKVYQKVTALEAYGYLDDANNECTWYQDKDQKKANARGFDLKLSNLTLVNGKVSASGANSYNYSVNLTTKKSDVNDKLTTAHKLGVTNKITTSTPGEMDRKDLAGSELSGGYEVTETRTEENLGSEEAGWRYNGSASTKYDSYKTWVKEEIGDFTAESTRYEGSLGYDYTITGSTTVDPVAVDANSITRSASTVRNVVATLSSTSVTRTPGSTTTTTTTPAPAPVTPTPVTPTDDDDDDPTPPTVIDEEDVPLAETPETPDVEIPDEEVPMAEEPDVEIPDEEVPLAEVPQTGDNFLLEALALAISSASGLWLGLGKKRRS